MLPYVVKKKEDLQIAINYIEGRITGNTRDEGLRLSKLENARKARAAYAVDVSNEIQERIKEDHSSGKLGQVRLSKKYGYSVSEIRRVLGAR